jgi:hypothetical protein
MNRCARGRLARAVVTKIREETAARAAEEAAAAREKQARKQQKLEKTRERANEKKLRRYRAGQCVGPPTGPPTPAGLLLPSHRCLCQQTVEAWRCWGCADNVKPRLVRC